MTNEETLLQQYQLPPIDILKVGHHGSKTSSSQAFIDAIHPRVSLISTGKNKRYHLPNKEVEERLNDNQSAILTTVENGEITLDLETSIESMLKPWKIYEPLKSSE
ncbi:ComEC/Rec2 family competence protein [Staphylococcus pettenkoferi]